MSRAFCTVVISLLDHWELAVDVPREGFLEIYYASGLIITLEDWANSLNAIQRRPIGTPISELSGRRGDPRNAAFDRIAESWGYH